MWPILIPFLGTSFGRLRLVANQEVARPPTPCNPAPGRAHAATNSALAASSYTARPSLLCPTTSRPASSCIPSDITFPRSPTWERRLSGSAASIKDGVHCALTSLLMRMRKQLPHRADPASVPAHRCLRESSTPTPVNSIAGCRIRAAAGAARETLPVSAAATATATPAAICSTRRIAGEYKRKTIHQRLTRTLWRGLAASHIATSKQ